MIWLTRSTRDRVTPAEMSSSDVPRRHQRLVRSSPRQQRGSDLIPASSIQPQSISVGIHHILLRPLISDELKSVLKLTLTRCEKRPVVSRSPNRDDCQLYRQLRRGWRDQPGHARRVRPFPPQKFQLVTSKEYDAEGHQDRTNHNSIINEAALLEVTPCEGVSVAVKIRSPWISDRTPSRVALLAGSRGLALLAAAAGRPGRLWRYLFDDAVGPLQQ